MPEMRLGVKVNVMLSGDCVESSAAATVTPTASIPSARDVFKRIADETGGLFFFLPNGTEEDYSEILAQIFEAAVAGSDTTPPVVTVTATPTILWPANHKMVRIGVDVLATDDQDPNVAAPAVVTNNTKVRVRGWRRGRCCSSGL